MPRVLVNDRCLCQNATGVGIYLRSLLEAWPEASQVTLEKLWTRRPESNMSGRRGEGESGGNAQGQQTSFPPSPPPPLSPSCSLRDLRRPGTFARPPWFARRMVQRWRGWRFARRFRRERFDAYFEPNHIAYPCDGPTVTTIHDLSVLDHPEWHPADRVRQWQVSLPQTVKQTVHWITDSRFSAGRMESALSIPQERITVIPLAGRDLHCPPRADAIELAGKWGLPPRFMLHVGTIEPRKNILTLLEAYAILPARWRRDCPLVLVGGSGWGSDGFWQELTSHPAAASVLACGYVSDAQAAVLLSAAVALVAPSHYEGFGLPIVEAFAAGTPVICSDIPPFKEIAEGYAEMISPMDAPAWAAAMTRAVEDESWRADRARIGMIRACDYSWPAAAAAHQRVLAGAAR